MKMFRNFTLAFVLSGILIAPGCQNADPQGPVSEDGPITLEEWRQLSPNIRFDIEFIERLKEGEPELKTKKGWKAFAETELKQSLGKSK